MANSGKSLTIDFLPVGQGDGILVTCPNGETILIDLGSASSCPVWGITGSYVFDYIKKQLTPQTSNTPSKKCLNYLILTHYDVDHWNHVADLLMSFDVIVKQVYLGGPGGKYSFRKKTTDKIYHVDGKPQIIPFPAKTMGKNIQCGDVLIRVLAASNAIGRYNKTKLGNKPNANSIVLCLEYKGKKVMFTGDATLGVKTEIMEKYSKEELKCHILKVAHHGSGAEDPVPPSKHENESQKDYNERLNNWKQEFETWKQKYRAWLDTVKPEHVFISAGLATCHHPRFSALEVMLGISSLIIKEKMHPIVGYVEAAERWRNHDTNMSLYTTVIDVAYKDMSGNLLPDKASINNALKNKNNPQIFASARHWQVKILDTGGDIGEIKINEIKGKDEFTFEQIKKKKVT